MKRKALGRGLNSLIPQAPPLPVVPQTSPRPADSSGLRQIDTDRIVPNPDQPRQDFDAESLEGLAVSLRAQGVLQPVVVRPRADGLFELIAGERRWRAAQIAGLLKVPAIVRDVADDRRLELALVENLQRTDLNPVEEALAYQALVDDLGLNQEEVAARVGKKRTTVANVLRILNLPADIQTEIRSGSISLGHAKALAALTNRALQLEIAKRIVAEDLSVRAVESIVKRTVGGAEALPVARRPVDPNVAAAQDALQKSLGTKVRIAIGRGRAGRIEIHFYSDEELDRLYQVLSRPLASARG
jgi:ParB family transcriptional regulator, chromosome partitioning protein